jgi:hypothetical protein
MAEKQIIKRIFLTGMPGSMWSGCDRRLRDALMDIDNSDWTDRRQWVRGDGGQTPHRGAYFNIGNEFGEWVCNFHKYSREEILQTVDSVYSPQPNKKVLIRIHKSHEFAHHLDQIHEQFPEAAIITVMNDPHKCLANWGLCDGHDHEYDRYDWYKRNYEHIWETINYQYWAVRDWIRRKQLPTNNLTKGWISNNITTRLKPPYDDGVDKYWDGVNTLYYPQDYGHGLVDTIRLSIIPWKTSIEEDLNGIDSTGASTD